MISLQNTVQIVVVVFLQSCQSYVAIKTNVAICLKTDERNIMNIFLTGLFYNANAIQNYSSQCYY